MVENRSYLGPYLKWTLFLFIVLSTSWSPLVQAKRKPKCSCSKEWVQTFRGNQTRSFYGTGYIPAQLKIRWRFRTRWIRDARLRGYGGRKLIWRGTGWSGQAAVVGDRVWVGSVGGVLYCLNRHNGRVLWTFRTGLSIKSSVTYWNNRVYFGSRSNRLYCLNASTGKLLWSYRTPGKNIDSTPLVWKGILYWGAEDFHLYAMNPINGKIFWKFKTMGSIESSPMVYQDKVYINSYDGHLYCLNRKTGHLMWRFRTGDDTDTTPTFHQDKVYLGSENGVLYALDAQTGELIWKRQVNGGLWSTPTVVGRRVFVGANDLRLYAFDAETGRMLWQYRTADGVWASIAHVAGRLIVGDWAGYLHVVRASDGERLARRRMGVEFKKDGNHIVSTAAVVQGRVYIGSRDGHFYCLEGPQKASARQLKYARRWRRRYGQDREAVVYHPTDLTKLPALPDISVFPAGSIRQSVRKALSSKKPYPRMLLARLLQKYTLPSKQAWVLLRSLLSDPAEHVRLEAVRAAGRYGRTAARATEALLRDKDERIRAAVCQLQGKLGRKSIVPQLKSMLWDRHGQVQVACARALLLLGEQRLGIRTLRRFLFGGRHFYSYKRGRKRIRLGCPTRVSKFFLYRTQKGQMRRKPREKQPIFSALVGLYGLGNVCAKKHLFSRWYSCKADRETGFCTIFSDWQGWMKRRTPRTVVPLLPKAKQFKALKRYGLPRYKDKNQRTYAFIQLNTMKTPKRIPLLLRALRSEKYAMIRIVAARGLKQIQSSKVLRALQRAVHKDRYPDVRMEAARSLVHLQRGKARPILQSALKKERVPRVKATLAALLSQLGSHAVHTQLKQWMRSPSRAARCTALQGLATFSEGFEHVRQTAHSREPFLQRCALKALLDLKKKGRIRPVSRKQLRVTIGSLVRHPNPAIALRATFAWLQW